MEEGGAPGGEGVRKPIPISSKLQLAHERLAHVSHGVVKHMAKSGAAHGLGLRDIGGPHGDAPSCDACKEGKATRAPFPTSTDHPNDPLEEVSIDILGPMRVPSRFGGHRYVLSIQDRATREVEGIPLVNKGDAARAFQEWVVGAERQTGKKLKAIRSDRGGGVSVSHFSGMAEEPRGDPQAHRVIHPTTEWAGGEVAQDSDGGDPHSAHPQWAEFGLVGRSHEADDLGEEQDHPLSPSQGHHPLRAVVGSQARPQHGQGVGEHGVCLGASHWE